MRQAGLEMNRIPSEAVFRSLEGNERSTLSEDVYTVTFPRPRLLRTVRSETVSRPTAPIETLAVPGVFILYR